MSAQPEVTSADPRARQLAERLRVARSAVEAAGEASHQAYIAESNAIEAAEAAERALTDYLLGGAS